MRNAFLLSLLCLCLVACGSTPRNHTLVTQAEARYSLAKPNELPKVLRVPLTERKGYLFMDATIDGHRAGSMLLDTGSSLNIVEKGLVNRLGLEKVGEGKTVGIAGTETFSHHRVDSFAVRDLDLGVDRAASLSLYSMTRGLGVNLGGIVGSTSFMSHPFAIDYIKRELVVYNRKTFVPPKDAERVRLEFYGRLPAVRAKLANGKEVLLIIDTGMNKAVALPVEIANWPGILATGASGAGSSRGVGGEIQTHNGWLKNLDVFGFNVAGVPVTFEPNTTMKKTNGLPVGRIGSELLRGFRLTYDARYRSLWAEFSSPVADE